MLGEWIKDMPIYEYQCDNCSRRFEIMQRIADPLVTSCAVCGGHVHRLISQTSFVLKGSGWYVTDYPSESRKKAMSQEKSGGDSKASDTNTSSSSTSSEKVSSTDSKA
jgi:putative FmdB family regulatory protein